MLNVVYCRVSWVVSSSREATMSCMWCTLFCISKGSMLPRWLTPTDFGEMANFLAIEANLAIGWALGPASWMGYSTTSLTCRC